MSALKVGDRVHVEYDAVLVRTHYGEGMAQVDCGDFHPIVPTSALTKLPELPDPEPAWVEDDVVFISGLPGLGRCLIWRKKETWLTVGQPRSLPDAAVSAAWVRGDIQRLVPEVTP